MNELIRRIVQTTVSIDITWSVEVLFKCFSIYLCLNWDWNVNTSNSWETGLHSIGSFIGLENKLTKNVVSDGTDDDIRCTSLKRTISYLTQTSFGIRYTSLGFYFALEFSVQKWTLLESLLCCRHHFHHILQQNTSVANNWTNISVLV